MDLQYSVPKFGNWTTKVSKIRRFPSEENHNRSRLFYEKHHYMFVDLFVQNLTRKREKDLTLNCDNVFRHSYHLNCSSHLIGLPLCTRSCCVKAFLAKNWRYYYYCFLESCRTWFWAHLPEACNFFASISSCIRAWNNSVGFALWSFGGSITAWIVDSLKHWRITGSESCS